MLMGESIGGAVAVDLAARDGAGRWCWKAPSTICPTWPPIIFPGFRFAGRCERASTRRARSGITTARCCSRTATPTRSCPCSSASACLTPPTSRNSFFYPGHDHNDPMPPEYYDRLARSWTASTIARRTADRPLAFRTHRNSCVSTHRRKGRQLCRQLPRPEPRVKAPPRRWLRQAPGAECRRELGTAGSCPRGAAR